MAVLCRRFGISRKTGYKWVQRFGHGESLADQSRRPARCPTQTPPPLEQQVLQLRGEHPAWGGRKIHTRLKVLGVPSVPAPSTITDILRRHGLIDPQEAAKHAPFVRFEHPCPNDLWQMDFKGQFRLVHGGWCFPLTILDDHSRFALALRACGDQKALTVQGQMIEVFRRYGLPCRILTDNGSPWGCDGEHRYTVLTVWLIRLGIAVSHGRPYHPQTQGKDERFHRTLNAELLRDRSFGDFVHAQDHFDAWRDVYNLQRPHEALDMAVPASRYRPSPRSYPQALPPIEYGPGDVVRRVHADGYLQYRCRTFKLSQAFTGYPVALRPTGVDGVLEVYFCHQRIAQIDLRDPFTGN
jgi:transposase InsO family protein